MRSKYTLRYVPYGQSALLINWPAIIAPEILYDIIGLKRSLTHEAILDRVVTYHSLTLIFHEPQKSFDHWIKYVSQQYEESRQHVEPTTDIHKIPVCYDPELGPDLVALAQEKHISIEALIKEHSAQKYLVYFIGFQPGFIYLGGLNPKLHTPRKSTPSRQVAKGSVAIGGAQTGIYPADAPGGWHVIGQTYLTLFNPSNTPASRFKSGDLIEFEPISRLEFDRNKQKGSDRLKQVERQQNNPVFKSLKSGIYSSLQDLGRHGYRAQGVVQSGAMDQISAQLANALVGNSPDEALLEITYGGLKLECLHPCNIALSGADFSAQLNNLSLDMNRVISLKKGDILALGQRKTGARTYVAIEHGFDAELVMGSRSFYIPVTENSRLNDGDLLYQKTIQESIQEIPHVTSHNSMPSTGLNEPPVQIDFSNSKTIVLASSPGPEYETLTDSIKKLLCEEFTIGINDRMAYFLKELIPNNASTIYSSAVLPGTVQLTPKGQVIILTNDAQVTGGYPRVLQLTNLALYQLSQLVLGQKVRFELFDPL